MYVVPVTNEKGVRKTSPVLAAPAAVAHTLDVNVAAVKAVRGALLLTLRGGDASRVLDGRLDQQRHVTIDGRDHVVTAFYSRIFGFEIPRETKAKDVNNAVASLTKTRSFEVGWCAELNTDKGTMAFAVTTAAAFEQLKAINEFRLTLNHKVYKAFLSHKELPTLELSNLPYTITTREAVERLIEGQQEVYKIASVKEISRRNGMDWVARVEMKSEQAKDMYDPNTCVCAANIPACVLTDVGVSSILSLLAFPAYSTNS